MKQYIFIKTNLAVLLFAVAIITSSFLHDTNACNKSNPEKNALIYLDAINSSKYEIAKTVSTNDTKELLESLSAFSALMPDSVKMEASMTEVKILKHKINGENAIVTYSENNSTDSKTISMVCVDKEWLVNLTKDMLLKEAESTKEKQ